ncbi:hypothetical protein BDA99DRAFT_492110 [Phascolomyces articulosus]|uniref:Uncharacterized protein n=1 Tax=Phascolomyces articulosus TaxID=60185 RepID=A0AAD5PKA7_9FUNG|nr:hypothetical protein BDA99DRAFT_492110 [Phascolomyces articulosus]
MYYYIDWFLKQAHRSKFFIVLITILTIIIMVATTRCRWLSRRRMGWLNGRLAVVSYFKNVVLRKKQQDEEDQSTSTPPPPNKAVPMVTLEKKIEDLPFQEQPQQEEERSLMVVPSIAKRNRVRMVMVQQYKKKPVVSYGSVDSLEHRQYLRSQRRQQQEKLLSYYFICNPNGDNTNNINNNANKMMIPRAPLMLIPDVDHRQKQLQQDREDKRNRGLVKYNHHQQQQQRRRRHHHHHPLAMGLLRDNRFCHGNQYVYTNNNNNNIIVATTTSTFYYNYI